MLRKFILLLLIGLFLFPLATNAQEFTIKKTPEQIQHEKEIKEEANYLKFQDYFFDALLQKSKEDYQKAIEALEKCKQIYPNESGMNFEFAKNYLLLKDYENAIFFDEKALESKPDNIYILEHLKKVYKSQRDFENAIIIQEKIIAVNPKKKSGLIPLYFQSRQRGKAKKLFLELESKQAIIENERYYKRILFPVKKATPNRIKDTVKTDIPIIKNNTIQQLQVNFKKNKNYKTLKRLLLEEEKQAKFYLLSKDCKNGLEFFPAQPYLYFMQGKAENKLLNYQKAVEVLKASLDYIIDDNLLESNIYTQIAKAYTGLGKTQKATTFLEKAKQLKK
jgi:tetratricopeptide (TPR) repeat protein